MSYVFNNAARLSGAGIFGEYTRLGAVTKSSSVWADANKTFSVVTKPAKGLISALPLSNAQKKTLVNAPLDFLLDIFDPLIDTIADINEAVRKRTGKNSRDFFGTKIDMRRDQPNDSKLDKSTLNLVRDLRAIQQNMVLFLTDPLVLADESVKKGINITAAIAKQTGKAIDKTVKDVLSFLNPFDGLGVEPASTAAAIGVEAALSAAAPPALQAIMDSMISTAVKEVTKKANDAVTNLISPKAAKPATSSGAPAPAASSQPVIITTPSGEASFFQPSQTQSPLMQTRSGLSTSTMVGIGLGGVAAIALAVALTGRK